MQGEKLSTDLRQQTGVAEDSRERIEQIRLE